MNKKQLMYDRINAHGQQLKSIFKLDPNIDTIKLCKQLFRLENKAHKLATDYCNGDFEGNIEKESEKIVEEKIIQILKNTKFENSYYVWFGYNKKLYNFIFNILTNISLASLLKLANRECGGGV